MESGFPSDSIHALQYTRTLEKGSEYIKYYRCVCVCACVWWIERINERIEEWNDKYRINDEEEKDK